MGRYSFDPGMGVPSVGLLVKRLKRAGLVLAIFIAVAAVSIIKIKLFPKYAVEWRYWPNYKDGSFVINPSFMGGGDMSLEEYPPEEFFMLYCRPTIARQSFLAWSVSPRREILEKMWASSFIWQDRIPELYEFGKEHMPFHVETQYVFENGESRYVILGYYTEDGIKKDIHEEYPLELNYLKESDYGPLRYNESLEFLPAEAAEARRREIAKNNYENRLLAEEGTIFRRYRAFFYPFFTLLTLAAAFAVLCYYRRYHPKYSMDFIRSGDDPRAEFYYVLPSPKMDFRVIGRFSVAPAKHLVKEHDELIKARDGLKSYCEEYRGSLPARFEADYIVGVSGTRITLKGYCTENGLRRDVSDSYAFDFIHYPETALPPEKIRPDLRWGREGRGGGLGL